MVAMHPNLMSVMAAERMAQLQASAANNRRGRVARIRNRLSIRPRARVAHA
jgi:hypothetical protein